LEGGDDTLGYLRGRMTQPGMPDIKRRFDIKKSDVSTTLIDEIFIDVDGIETILTVTVIPRIFKYKYKYLFTKEHLPLLF